MIAALKKLAIHNSQLIVLFILFFLSFTFYYLLSASPASAQTGPQDLSSTNYKAPQHANYTINNLLHTVSCELAGKSLAGKCLATISDGKTQTIVLFDQIPNGGAIGSVTSTIAVLYIPPTSSVEYLATLGEQIGIIKPAYANQLSVGGSGAGVIKPILTVWTATRNIAYLAFIVIFLVVGLMIMFRQKINPQTVIGIQQALPGLVVGLILITFSYFLAALMVDIAFVGTTLMAKIFISAGPNMLGGEQQINDFAQKGNVLQIFSPYFMKITGDPAVSQATEDLIKGIDPSGAINWILPVITATIAAVIALLLPGVGWVLGAGMAVGGALAGTQISGIVSLLVPAILLIAMLIQAIRLLFQLIGTYIQILIMTIAGPLIILASAVPGKGGMLSWWWKTILANALVFPAVFACFLFAGVILATPQTDWQTSLPLFGNLPIGLVRVLIAYGILLGTPSVPEIVRTAFGVKGPQSFVQTAVGGAMAGATVGYAGVATSSRSLSRPLSEVLNKLSVRRTVTGETPPSST